MDKYVTAIISLALSGCSLLSKDIEHTPAEIITVPDSAAETRCEVPAELLVPFNKSQLPEFEQLICKGRPGKTWVFKHGHVQRMGNIINRYNELYQYAQDLTAPLHFVEMPVIEKKSWWQIWR